MRCVLLITAAVASAFKASVRSGPSSLMEQLPPPPRIIVDRPAVGWIDEPNGKLRLRNVPGDASIVTVEKPTRKFFHRGDRKRAPAALPSVFELEYFKVIVPHVDWKPKGGPCDCVCLNCFCQFKSPPNGQDSLFKHAVKCWDEDALAPLYSLKNPADRRTSLGDAAMPYDEELECDVLGMRWARNHGRPSMIFDDEGLDIWISAASRGAYRPPGRKFAGASGELACIDYQETVKLIDGDLELGWLFYSGQPFIFFYNDLWSSTSKLPFMGLESSFYRPWATKRQERRHGAHLGLVHLPGRHGGEEIALATAEHLTTKFSIFKKHTEDIYVANDQFQGTTDISALVIEQRTDSGGGIPTAARRMGCDRGACYLHDPDLALARAFCLIGDDKDKRKKLTPSEQQIYALVQKCRKMVSHFANSNLRDERC